MKIYSMTDPGRVRANNQDSFAAANLTFDASYAVVCDGMGGANGGNIASSIAVKRISESFAKNFRNNMSDASIRNLMTSAISTANSAILSAAANNPDYKGMGTTVVCAIAVCGHVFIAHLGDSRAYLYKNKTVKQLTRDHSVIQSMIDSGKISKAEAKYHPKKNVITRAIGVYNDIDIEFDDADLENGDALLICTDGLTNFVEDDRIAFLFNSIPHEELPTSLIHAANSGGGGDNITAVILFNE